MKLWRIEKGFAHDPFIIVDEDNRLIISGNHQGYAQQICDKHNAWVILAERGWSVFPSAVRENGRPNGWHASRWDGVSWKSIWCGNNLWWPDPSTAVIKAYEWLKERRK